MIQQFWYFYFYFWKIWHFKAKLNIYLKIFLHDESNLDFWKHQFPIITEIIGNTFFLTFWLDSKITFSTLPKQNFGSNFFTQNKSQFLKIFYCSKTLITYWKVNLFMKPTCFGMCLSMSRKTHEIHSFNAISPFESFLPLFSSSSLFLILIIIFSFQIHQ